MNNRLVSEFMAQHGIKDKMLGLAIFASVNLEKWTTGDEGYSSFFREELFVLGVESKLILCEVGESCHHAFLSTLLYALNANFYGCSATHESDYLMHMAYIEIRRLGLYLAGEIGVDISELNKEFRWELDPLPKLFLTILTERPQVKTKSGAMNKF